MINTFLFHGLLGLHMLGMAGYLGGIIWRLVTTSSDAWLHAEASHRRRYLVWMNVFLLLLLLSGLGLFLTRLLVVGMDFFKQPAMHIIGLKLGLIVLLGGFGGLSYRFACRHKHMQHLTVDIVSLLLGITALFLGILLRYY